MIITLASSKGGVGKSTITGCLAGVWAADGDTVHIVDLDNNRTVSRWFADTARRPDGITVTAPDPAGLTEHLAELAATSNPDLILIDVAGTYERALTVAVARAHLTLIPAAPTEADIYEASRVARHITSVFEAFGREPLYRLLLNRVQPLSSGAQLYATLEIVRLRLPRLKTRILQRAAYEELGLSGHRHIHIILNRVDHETGRTLDDYKERKRSQVWALAYEKQHEAIRCEERELRAAKREGRAPDLEPTRQSPEKDAGNDAMPSPSPRQPANDHLPHNVVMLARPEEKAFKAHEQAREEVDKQQREQLKAEQRAEREAFFKDGAKQFKATRHAVYDEVRKEYAPEWTQFYKDADAAGHSAEAWSQSAVSRALFFSKDGRWDEARSAFDIRVEPAGNAAPEPDNVVIPALEVPEVTRQLSDLAAGAIGSAASYLADQLGELFAPTPPEVREAQAKAAAKHEAEKPAPEEKTNPYARQIEAALRIIEAEREQQKERTYFEERDRDKGWERDQ